MRLIGLPLALSIPLFAGTFTITNLGDPNYDTESAAINAAGGTAITSFLPGLDSIASGINDYGLIAGTTFTATGAQAMLFYDGQAWAVANFAGDSYARDVNNSGQVAGSANNQAYVAQNGQVTYLTHSLPAIADSANAINESGAVAGTLIDAWGISRGYIWFNGQTTWTGMLGGQHSAATNLNDNDQSTGYAQTGDGWMHAYLASDGLTLDLGTLGGTASYAYGINNTGDVVGFSFREDGTMGAFLYTNGIMLDLSSLTEGLHGWTLAAAYGINDAGQITGTGFYNGRRTAFRLDPVFSSFALAAAPVPEPSTGMLLLTGVLLIFLSRRWGNSAKSE